MPRQPRWVQLPVGGLKIARTWRTYEVAGGLRTDLKVCEGDDSGPVAIHVQSGPQPMRLWLMVCHYKTDGNA